MKNQHIIIVGGTDGIGRALANHLAAHNKVLIIGRSEQKGQDFLRAFPQTGTFLPCNLSELRNIPPLMARIREAFSSVDFIVHCADILRVKRVDTAEGLEVAIATNYYSRVLFNHLALQSYSSAPPQHILHIAAAGFPPPRKILNSFPVSPDRSSFRSHGLGQVLNDFYGVSFSTIAPTPTTRINILNPGIVDTDIRRKGQFPAWVRRIAPLFGLLVKSKIRTPEAYMEIPLAVMEGHNPEASTHILINSKGKGLRGSKRLHNPEVQAEIYRRTVRDIEKVLGKSMG